jgi:aminopeptidase-like protein
MLWVLNQADGTKSLLGIAERAKLPFDVVEAAARTLAAAGLLEHRAFNRKHSRRA